MGLLTPIMTALHKPIYEARQKELVHRIVPELCPNDRVLDVGCGFGALGRAILDTPGCPPGVTVQGVERVRRGGELIDVIECKAPPFPFEDGAFDAVILADVLHHDPNPDGLIAECKRLTRRLLIIKDHKIDGPLAQARVSLIDWAANAPHGVPCLYKYHSTEGWRDSHRRHGLKPVRELTSMRLYPPVVNELFGGRLQYMAVLERAA